MAGILNWDLGDTSTSVNSNLFSHHYTSPGNKSITVYKGTATGPGDITQVRMESDDLVGALDLSTLINLTLVEVGNNKKLTQIKNPLNNTQNWTGYQAYNCDLTGVLDVSNLKLSGNFYVYGNPNLTNILNPSTGNTFSAYWAGDCDLTGTFSLKDLTKLGGQFLVGGNHHLTKIINPTSSQAFSMYWVYDNSLNGTLDVSGLTNLGGSFFCYGNRELNKILFPPNALTFNSGMRLEQCNLLGTLDISNFTLGGNFYVNENPNLMGILHKYSATKITYRAYDCSLTGTLDVSALDGIWTQFDIHNNIGLTTLNLPTTLNHGYIYLVDVSGCTLSTESVDNIYKKFSDLWDASLPTTGVFMRTSGGYNSPPTDASQNTYIQNIISRFNTASLTATFDINDGPTELLNFDGKYYVSDGFTHSASTGIDYRISMDCYVDVSGGIQGTYGSNIVIWVGGVNMGFHFLGDNTTQNGTIVYYAKGSTIKYECPMMTPKQKHHIDLYYNNTTVDISLYIDGSIQAKNATVVAGVGGTGVDIGYYHTTQALNLKNAAVWNIDLNGDHFYTGEPSGNTNSAWADTIGNWDLTISKISGAPDPSVRYAITGTQHFNSL